MNTTITIPHELEKRLLKHADSFSDTPAGIIQRLLDEVEAKNIGPKPTVVKKSNKDYTKYIFNGKRYGKCRLVQAVLAEHISRNPEITYRELEQAFPKELGSIGCFMTPKDVEDKFCDPESRCHYDQKLELRDEVVLASSQWTQWTIPNFIMKAHALGYDIQEA